ncbi:MAG: YcxB family protein [Chitinophagaceae bacterium]|nr:YcxB family protein [Chitinophagaceae bacterium]
MQNSFTIRQELSLREFLIATLYSLFLGRRMKIFLFLMTGVALASLFLGYATTSDGINLSALATAFAPLVMILIIFTVFICFGGFFVYKSNPHLFKNVSYTFTHWGIVRQDKRGEFSKPWRDISKFKETKSFLLVYPRAGMDTHIIQKRMFADSEELNAFRQLLNDNIKD